MIFESGIYYIGDLCYLWDEYGFGSVSFKFQTKYGDGIFIDNKNNEYIVDSGTIGIIDINQIHSTKLRNIKNGNLYKFYKSFECSENDGILKFGYVVIDTNFYNGELNDKYSVKSDDYYDYSTDSKSYDENSDSSVESNNELSDEEDKIIDNTKIFYNMFDAKDQLTNLIQQGFDGKVIEFLNENKDPEFINKALILACGWNKLHIIKKLKLNKKSNWEYALDNACRMGNIEIINYILNHKYFDFSQDKIFESLRFVCIEGHINIIKWLFEKHSYLFVDNDQEDDGSNYYIASLLGFSCEVRNNKELIDYLIEREAPVDYGLEEASRVGCLENVKYMIEKGATLYDSALYNICEFYINNKDIDTKCINETRLIIKLLFSKGAVVNWHGGNSKEMFIVKMDVLYEMTTFESYKSRLMNMDNVYLLIDKTNVHIIGQIQKFF